MCHQNIEKRPCSHHTRYKPHFCRYRFNINHQIEPRFSYSSEPCKECLAARIKPASPEFGFLQHGKWRRAEACQEGADASAKCVEDRGGAKWRRKLRNKSEKTEGNEEILKGSMVGVVPAEEEESD